jgi:hypothetical protein
LMFCRTPSLRRTRKLGRNGCLSFMLPNEFGGLARDLAIRHLDAT